jgi:DNA-directed RNA polymerase subunit RPC12/RpoP
VWINVRHAKICDGYGHVLYVCLNCDRTFNKFHIKLEDNGEFFEPEHKCITFKVKLIQLDNEESEVRKDLEVDKFINKGCPKCGEKLLVEMMFERLE